MRNHLLLIFFLLISVPFIYSQNDYLTQEQKEYLDRFGNPNPAENIPVRLNSVIKWSEGFEDATFPPAGWNVYNVDGGTQQWLRYATTPIFGTASAAVRWESATLTNDDWLVTPQFLVDNADTLKFWAKMQSTSYTDSCQIWYSTTGGTPPTGYSYLTTVIPTTTPALYQVDLSSLAGQNVFIAFRYYALDQFRLYLDSVYVENSVIPVELTSFTAISKDDVVELNWSTATETNNQGFEIQRSSGGEFEAVGFVAGYGTTTERKTYTFTDKNLKEGRYTYRLKQIDYDGKFEYSNSVEVEVNAPLTFALEQNYPNPFNPATQIKYSIAKDAMVNISVYNAIGEKVRTLVNGQQQAGRYEIKFDGSGLTSGIYFYSIEAGEYKSIRKMVLMK